MRRVRPAMTLSQLRMVLMKIYTREDVLMRIREKYPNEMLCILSNYGVDSLEAAPDEVRQQVNLMCASWYVDKVCDEGLLLYISTHLRFVQIFESSVPDMAYKSVLHEALSNGGRSVMPWMNNEHPMCEIGCRLVNRMEVNNVQIAVREMYYLCATTAELMSVMTYTYGYHVGESDQAIYMFRRIGGTMDVIPNSLELLYPEEYQMFRDIEV